MSWLDPADRTAPAFEALLAYRPELLALYKRFYGTFWDDALLPRSILELCRVRIAQLHDCEAELALSDPGSGVSPAQRAAIGSWERAACFSPAERSALALAEKMPWAHHAITDEEHRELRGHFTQPQAVALTVALALIDANCRLRLVFELAAEPAAAMPSAAGPLH